MHLKNSVRFLLFVCLLLTVAQSVSIAQLFPARELRKLFEVFGTPQQNLGTSCAGNFDLNRDGNPDFAVGTMWDTTMIYYGGKGILDTLWDLRIMGGQNGIVTGDFDGDGLLDIVTSGYDQLNRYQLGKVYYFKGRRDAPYLDTIPQVTVSGDTSESLGKKLLATDLNGDQVTDLIVYSTQGVLKKPRSTGVLRIFFGGAKFLTDSPVKLEYTKSDSLNAHYAVEFKVGDINGDSIQDIVVWSNQKYSKLPRDSVDFYLEIFYGKKGFSQRDTIPDAEFHRRYNPFLKDYFSIVDLNGDHIDDLCFMTQDTFLFHLGKKANLGQLGPFVTIPNPDPSRFLIESRLYKISDFNGDGFEDFMTIVIEKNFPAWFFAVYLCGPHWNVTPSYFYHYAGKNVGFITSYVDIGDVNGDRGSEFIITRPMGDNENNVFTYNNGDFVVVKSDTALTMGMRQSQSKPNVFNLDIFPNPFHSTSTISFTLPKSMLVSVVIYDMLGRKIRSLLIRSLPEGKHTVQFESLNLSIGTYLCRIVAGEYSSTQQIVIVR